MRLPVITTTVLSGVLGAAGFLFAQAEPTPLIVPVPGAEGTPRPEPSGGPGRGDWASPIQVEGIPNLYKVSDDLYRGGQPTAAGYVALRKMKIKTVVSLRAFYTDEEAVGRAGLAYRTLDREVWIPSDAETVAFLRLVTDSARTPVYVHCRQGHDRSVVMSAVYRVVVEGWSKEDAIREMTEGGSGFSPKWKDLIRFVQDLDVDDLRRRVGIQS